jgi:hypothetical protein
MSNAKVTQYRLLAYSENQNIMLNQHPSSHPHRQNEQTTVTDTANDDPSHSAEQGKRYPRIQRQ